MHLAKIYFDRRSARTTDEWLRRRFKLFSEQTLVSLRLQTQPHRLWFCCEEGMEDVTQPLRELCPHALLTFGKSKRPQLEGDDPYVYVTRIDSDDLYACDALELAAAVEPTVPGEVEASMFRRGYMYDVRDGRISTYYNISSPFHTLMFPRGVWDSSYEAVLDHSKVSSSYRIHPLPDWKFAVLLHGNNYLSTFEYSRQHSTPVPRSWTVHKLMLQPVVFDVDDFCDEHACFDELLRLRARYPGFRCTLFAIPARCSQHLLDRASRYEWIEVAMHGISHVPNEELRTVGPRALLRALRAWRGAKGFRPPGWYIEPKHIAALNEAGFWCALHAMDAARLGPQCHHGWYACGERWPYWHGHTHDTCGNWLQGHLPALEQRWSVGQDFMPVSEALLCAS